MNTYSPTTYMTTEDEAMGDPLKDFWEKMIADEEWLDTRPICDQCGERIQDDCYWLINGEKFCESCLDWHKVFVD